jgi:hypothetical protein
MRNFKLVVLVSLFTCGNAFAVMDAKDLTASPQYTQSIHVVNLLANTSLSDVGMTASPVIVKYYNGNSYPCWTSTLNFQEDTAVHAGPRLGCENKINQVVVTPLLVANKLKTYLGSASVDIDTTKYATHVTIVQSTSPQFDRDSGLVVHSGNLTIQAQAD